MYDSHRFCLSGWATRNFTLQELKEYLYNYKPYILEISKDFVENNISIKKLFVLLEEYKKDNELIISFAGTTDFITSSNLSFKDYLNYLSIQGFESVFLKSDFFRVIIGDNLKDNNILNKLSDFKKIIYPVKIIIEIHAGWESNLENITKIINETNFNFVIDFQNLYKSKITFKELLNFIPKDRVEYYHIRNLPCDYIEDNNILLDEKNIFKNNNLVLWEPKLIDKDKIKSLFYNFKLIDK